MLFDLKKRCILMQIVASPFAREVPHTLLPVRRMLLLPQTLLAACRGKLGRAALGCIAQQVLVSVAS